MGSGSSSARRRASSCHRRRLMSSNTSSSISGSNRRRQASSSTHNYLTKSLFKSAVTCPRKLQYAIDPQQRYGGRHRRSITKDPLLLSLAEDGRKFERYCHLRHFRDGIEIGGAGSNNNRSPRPSDNSSSCSSEDSLLEFRPPSYMMEDLAEQTRSLLLNNNSDETTTTTILEGVIIYKNFLVRPDVLQLQKNNNSNSNDDTTTTTLSLIEIKAKSWDSVSMDKNKHMVGKRGGIKSSYLSYIQDVAFQKWVLQMSLYPEFSSSDYNIRSYLMMPDKSKTTKINNLNQQIIASGDDAAMMMMTMENNGDDDKTTTTVGDGSVDDEEELSVLVDITDLVDRVIYDDNLKFPGSNNNNNNNNETGGGEVSSFVSAAMEWADVIIDNNNNNNETVEETHLPSPPPIGLQCKNCEYRCYDDGDSSTTGNILSGFDQCWKEATANKINLENSRFPKVVDLWYGIEKDISKFISGGKYLLSDLSNEDLGFTDDGCHEIKKKKKSARSRRSSSSNNNNKDVVASSPSSTDDERCISDGGDGISRSRRQLYQAKGLPLSDSSSSSSPPTTVFLDKEYLRQEMESNWNYPYHFIDFETTTPVLPYFAGMAPFQTIAFQFSHHILHENGQIDHASEFLHVDPDDDICPNLSFVKALSDSIGNCNGSVFRWGIHENTVLSSLLQNIDDSCPDDFLAAKDKLQPLLKGGDRAMVDLMNVATKSYFVSGSDGSSSIKKLLLPTLRASSRLQEMYGTPTYTSGNFTNMQWYYRENNNDSEHVWDPYDLLKEMEQDDVVSNNNNKTATTTIISDGGAAIAAYNLLRCDDSLSVDERADIEKSLLRYCELDTLAMVMIVQAWQDFLAIE